MTEAKDYYQKRKKRYLKVFNLVVRSARSVLDTYLEGEDVDALVEKTRREFESLLPQLPYIGGKQPFTEFVAFTGMLLALHRTNLARGGTVEQTGEMMYEIGRAFLTTSPSILKRMLARMNFSPWYLRRLQKRAAESHGRMYPDDYVYDFIPGDGVTFDYGVDYLECTSCKFLAKQDAADLAPYLCPVDILYSQTFGWGLKRTMTLAGGAERCDFRFKQGGKTEIAVPPSMQKVIERGR